MKPSEHGSETIADGGDTESGTELFTQVADTTEVPEGRYERIRQLLISFVYVPFAVAWEDWRTRYGGAILIAYIAIGFLGPLIVPEPVPLGAPQYLGPFHDGWIGIGSVTLAGVTIPWIELSTPLGTEATGQSMVSLLVYGTIPMFKLIVAGALFSVVLGTFLGVFAGYRGGRVDSVIMAVTDVFLTIPGLALIVVIAAVLQPNNPYVVGLILGIDNWPGLTRTVRSQVLSIREESYVEAHRALGLSTPTILWRDITSPLMSYISINFANGARRIIFESVGLYFIGILPFSKRNWGVLLKQAYDNISLTNVNQLYWLFEPMIMIMGLSIGLILFAQGLDRVFNVRLRARHAEKPAASEASEDG